MPFSDQHNEDRQFRDHQSESRTSGARIIVAFFGVLLLFSILVYRYYDLQIVKYDDFVTRADSNRIQVQPIPPNRGLIFDRNGILLADNRPSYTLSVVKERTTDLEQTLAAIAEIIPVDKVDLKAFRRGLNQRRRPYEAVPLRYRLTEEEIARIAVNEYRLQGVEVEATLVRYYPHGELFAHALGYVGRINETELASFDEDTDRRYSGTHSIGKLGIEAFYENQLLGEVGTQHVEVNAHGRVLRVLDRIDPAPGKDLHLHLDIQLQMAATEALKGTRGALAAIDVKTGGVLAFVSMPSFDANLFVTGISQKDYRALNQSADLPLYNRVIQGQYPPGSTLKPMLGLGGLTTGVINTSWRIRDPGFYQLSNRAHKYRDWKKWGHGNQVDLRQAIVESCDTFFYDLSLRLGIDRMHPIGVAFGLGDRTGIDVPNERTGNWPSQAWKKAVRGESWYPGDSLNVSIGQGAVLATPLQLSLMTSVLASRGELRRPRLVRQIGEEMIAPENLGTYLSSPANWDYVTSAMTAVIHSPRGTAKGIAKDITYTAAGKTGTAQVVGIAQNEKYDRNKINQRNWDHALFIAYAPVEDPQIALAVIVENGEHGSSTAAPVARKVFDAWFARSAARESEQPHTPGSFGNTAGQTPGSSVVNSSPSNAVGAEN